MNILKYFKAVTNFFKQTTNLFFAQNFERSIEKPSATLTNQSGITGGNTNKYKSNGIIIGSGIAGMPNKDIRSKEDLNKSDDSDLV